MPLGKVEDEGRKGGADGDGERDGIGEGEERERERQGNPELGGYDCVIWTTDALRRLVLEGLVVVKEKDIGMFSTFSPAVFCSWRLCWGKVGGLVAD